MIDDASVRTARLTRREMVRRLAGSGALCAGMALAHPIHKHLTDGALLARADAQGAATSWAPIFLDPHQNETLISLAERIVPNSSKAQVNRFLDLLLSVDTVENQKKFTDSLSAVDLDSKQRFGHPFKTISEAEQNTLLTIFAAPTPSSGKSKREGWNSSPSSSAKRSVETRLTLNDHFENLKGWVSGAYYSSETGMRELGWQAEYVFDSFPGCRHPGGHP